MKKRLEEILDWIISAGQQHLINPHGRKRAAGGKKAAGQPQGTAVAGPGHRPSATGHRHRHRIASETKFQAARSAAGGIEKGWVGEGYNDFRAMGHMLIIIVEQKPRKIK